MTPPSKWLFFPSPAATGPLQTITYDMTSATGATISNSGDSIINPDLTGGVAWQAGKMRLWNGEAAEDAANFSSESGGRYNFTSGTTCRDWWGLYAVSATLNGGSSISLNATQNYGSGAGREVDGAVRGSCQTSYVNCSYAVKGSAFVSGDTVVLTVTAV